MSRYVLVPETVEQSKQEDRGQENEGSHVFHEFALSLKSVDVLRTVLTHNPHPVGGLDEFDFTGLVLLAILLTSFDPASQMGFFGAEVSPTGVAVHVPTSAVRQWWSQISHLGAILA